MHALLNVAVMAARRAGATLIRKMANLQKLKIEEKGHNDFVSDADRAAEKAVIDCVHKHYPDHAILGEEEQKDAIESDDLWVIDPLDGTNNFVHGVPHFAVSIAYFRQGVAQCGVVYNPITEDRFEAERGAGAYHNGERIRVASETAHRGIP